MFFDKIKSLLSNDIGIDLGTMNTLVYVVDRGVVLQEPSVVAINADTGKVLAVGSQAKIMIGRTPGNIRAIRPMREGVIADAEVTDEMLRYFIRRASGRFKIMQPRVLIAVPTGITGVETRAVQDSARRAGARDVRLVQEPLASAIGVGLPVEEPTGSMVIDIGGGTTEVAIISLANIVHSASVKCAGDAMDESIVKHMKKVHNLLIGERTAEEIKIQIGSAYKMDEEKQMEVKGRDIGQHGSCLPRMVTITSEEIREALSEPVSRIVYAVRTALDTCKPELSADLIDNGIVLAGGGALLRGLDRLLSEETGLAVSVASDALRAVVNGTGVMLESPHTVFSQPIDSSIGRGDRGGAEG
ncbi:MAG TPA: rod shape-determining protein [Lentisphaeria bacterium]|nr:rod shape-determining protein [Lentisphaeria bacterium]